MSNTLTADTTHTAAAPMSWEAEDWEGITPAPRKAHDRSKLNATESADVLARARTLVAASVSDNRSLIVDGIPETLPGSNDLEAWRGLADLWSGRTDSRPQVWVSGVPQLRRDALAHVHHSCPVLAKSKSRRGARTWAGNISAFTENRLCVACFGTAPQDVAEVFALGVAARLLRRFVPLRAVRMPRYGHSRTECAAQIARLTDVAAIVADYDPRVADICVQAAAAGRHAYDTAAHHQRTTAHLDAATFRDNVHVNVPDDVLDKLFAAPATVRLSGAVWVGAGGYRIAESGAMFDLGKTRLDWETNACTALFLLHASKRLSSGAKIDVDSPDPTFALALRLSEADPHRFLENWATAEAILA